MTELGADGRLGPAMLALNERQRKFVHALMMQARKSNSRAARMAGYSATSSLLLRVTGHRLAHDPKVKEISSLAHSMGNWVAIEALRQMAIRALAGFAKGSRPRPDVVSILQEARKDSDLQIRRSAVFALARLQDDGIARDLSEMRKDPDAEIRLQVATAITAASPKFTDAGKLLDEMVKDTDKKVRIEAIGGLAKRKELASVPALKNLTQQPDPEVRRAVFAALLQLRTPENAADLRPVFQKGMSIQDSQVRLSCVQALADKTAAGEDLEALRQAAFDQSKEVKLAAIAVLQASKLPEAMDALANLFGDPDMEVREKALEALASIPAGELKKQKSRYLQDFIETPDMPEKLKKRAAELQKTV